MTLGQRIATNGYALFHPSAALVQACQQPTTVVPRRKKFCQSLWVHPDIVREVQALQLEDVLRPYLPTATCTSVELYHSVPQAVPYRSGQLWHLDIDAIPQVKLFIVCQDTQQEQGPFTYLSASDSDRLASQTQYVPGKSLDDTCVTGPVQQLIGPAGSALLIDTSRCFHFGSRVTSGERRILVAQFV